MPKIIKNGKEYSGVPIEVVTAWAPTADPVQVKEPLMGNTDISTIGDGTVTGAIDGLTNLIKSASFSGTTNSYGNLSLSSIQEIRYAPIVSAICNQNSIYIAIGKNSTGQNMLIFRNINTGEALVSTEVEGTVYYI